MFIFSLANDESRPALKHDPLHLNPPGTNGGKNIRLINSGHFSFVNNLSSFEKQDIYLYFLKHPANFTQSELENKMPS